MARIIFKGKIDSDFEGFNKDTIFKMNNGTYWIQAQYRYWYHYAYRPDAVIIEENGRTILTVAGESIPVYPIYDVIESRIDGTFDGWDSNKRYKLVNGQVWEQAQDKCVYKYAYSPKVIIFKRGGKSIMHVKGTQVAVSRV